MANFFPKHQLRGPPKNFTKLHRGDTLDPLASALLSAFSGGEVEEVALQFLEPKWGEGVFLFLVGEKACCRWRFRMQKLLVFFFLGGG